MTVRGDPATASAVGGGVGAVAPLGAARVGDGTSAVRADDPVGSGGGLPHEPTKTPAMMTGR
jgi:hypothetical protein